jgi:ubiquinone/menaquinone biosynthesis C-methylase UbiE
VKQRDIFLQSEGNAWFKRNAVAAPTRGLPESDPLLAEIRNLSGVSLSNAKILEIGCSDGVRLQWLNENLGCDCRGLEPSAEAVDAARARGVLAQQGTAEELPYHDQMFDIVMFGFCLYLCDREDLFRIACEADRVLKDPGWLLILDFYSPTPAKREYHHVRGLFSYKMDYRSLFTWNPAYTCYSHRIRHHEHDGYTDDPSEWVATSVLRKSAVTQCVTASR